jgi:parvulin-like peptidyl-prolyl isomerase
MFNKNKKKKTALGRVGRVEREQRYRQIVRITTIVVVSLVVLVTIIGLVYNTYIIPSKTIVSIDGNDISTGYFQKRVKLERDRLVNQYNMYYSIAVNISDTTQQQSYLSYLSQIESQLEPDVVGQSVMNQIIDEIFIKREADKRGITVTDQEVDDYFYSLFGYYPNGVPTSTPTMEILPTSTLSATQYALITPTPEPTAAEATETTDEAAPTTAVEPTQVPLPTSVTEEEFATQSSDYLDQLKSYGIDEAFMKDLVKIQLFRDKLNAEIQKGITPEEEQVWARHILVDDEATAQDLLDQLQNGADFGDLAREYSTGPSGPNGGDLGWFARGQMITEFEDAAFSGEIGDIIGPVETTYGFHIIQILGKEMRPVNTTTMDNLVLTALTEILNEDKTNSDIVFPIDNWIKYTPTEPNVISVLGTSN